MASRILLLRRPALPSFSLRSLRTLSPTQTTCAATLIATPLLLSTIHPHRVRLDAFSTQPSPLQTYQREAKTPVVKDGKWNERALRQVTTGSIAGLLGGVLVSFFSKPLALLIGLLVIGAQALESRGIHIIPYKRMQRYVSGVDLRSSIQDNAALKISFGVTFALAAFAQF